MRDLRQALMPVPEPDDEKTPVLTYHPQLDVMIRDAQPPRPAATRLRHLPIHPRASSWPPSVIVEPSIIVEPDCNATQINDNQPETLFGVRRRYARNLELTLVAGLSALLTWAISALLVRAPLEGIASDTARARAVSSSNSVAGGHASPAQRF